MEHDIWVLPVTEPVAFFTLMLGIILLVPMLFERLRLPGLVGLILAGVVIGPNGLHLVDRSNSVVLLATIGLLYVMFIAGLEIDLGQFKKYRQRSIFLGTLSFAIPQALGTFAGLAFGFGWMGAILLGSVLASHTLLAYPIVSRLGLGKRLSVTTAVGGTILTDLLALLVLAVVAGGAHGQLDLAFWLKLSVSLVVYSAAVLWIVPRLANAFFKNVGTRREQEFIFVLGVMFAVSFFARVAGVEAIIGAFLAGLTLNRFLPESSPLLNRIQFVGNALFVPFFLLATGMLVDVRVLVGDFSTLIVAATITGIVVFSKYFSSWLTGAWYGYSNAERMTMFGLTVPQAAATLAATLTGHKLGLFDLTMVNAVIVMMLVTCVLGPYVVQRFGRRMVAENDAEPMRVEDAPERILVPFSNPLTVDSLMDLALFVRATDHQEPIFPLMVVRPDDSDTQAQVAKAERHLAHAALHLASADVPVVPLTRVGLNVAMVVNQAATDTRSSMMILGWNGERSLKDKVFGTIIDQVLEHGTAMTIVSHLTSPLVTTRRVILVIPPLADRHPGFMAAMQSLKRLVSRLGASVTFWEIGAGQPPHREAMDRVFADLPSERVVLGGWRDVTQTLRAMDKAGSLVVFLADRDGDGSGLPVLNKLPEILSASDEPNFLVLYPPELSAPEGSESPPYSVITPKHAVISLESDTQEAAFDGLYAHALTQLPDVRSLPTRRPEAVWTKVASGASVSGLRIPHWPEMTVVIGIHQSGLPVAGSDHRVHLFLLCLTPAEMPLDLQSAYMKWIAAQVAEPTIAEHLKRGPASEEVATYFHMTTAPLG